MAQQMDVPIFRIPDKILMKICSYITSIKPKMELEQVCRRFNRVSSHSESWQGVHSLQLMMKCHTQPHRDIDVFTVACNKENAHLNGVAVPFENWPKAIASFLNRTELHRLALHYGGSADRVICRHVFSVDACASAYYTLFPLLKEVFDQKDTKIKIQSLEIHGTNHPEIIEADGLKNFILDLFHLAVPYLQELCYFVINFDNDIERLVWQVIKECNLLKSIRYRDNYDEEGIEYYDSLIGKPLIKIMLQHNWDILIYAGLKGLVNVINGVSGEGLQSFTLKQETNITTFVEYFADHLTENAREKLKFLSLPAERCAVNVLSLIPLMFLNMENVHLEGIYIHDNNFDQFSTKINQFFDLTHDGLVSRRFTLEKLVYGKNLELEPFKVQVAALCNQSQIHVEFGQMPFLILSKGKSSFVLNQLDTRLPQLDLSDGVAGCTWLKKLSSN